MTKFITHTAPQETAFDVALGSFNGSISSGEKVLDVGLDVINNNVGSRTYHFCAITDKLNNTPILTTTLVGEAGTSFQGVIGSINGSFNTGNVITHLDVGIGTGSNGAVTEYAILAAVEGGPKTLGNTSVFGYTDISLEVAIGSLAGSYAEATDVVTRSSINSAFDSVTGSIVEHTLLGVKRRKDDSYYIEFMKNRNV